MDDDDIDWEAAAQVAEAEAVKYEKAQEALANVRHRLSQQDANESQEDSAPNAALESEQPSDYRVEFLEGVGVPRPAALGAFEVLAMPLALAGFDGDAGLCVLCALAVELGESDQALLHRFCEARPDDVVSLCRVQRAGTTNALAEKVKFVVNDWRFLKSNGLWSPPRVAAPPPAASSPKLAAVFRSSKPPVAVRSPKPAAAPSPKPQAARSPKPAVRSPQPPQVQSSIPTFFTKKPLDVEKKRPRDIAESELCAGFGPKDLDDGSASDSDGEGEGFGAVELSENVLQSQGCPDFDDEARREEEPDGEEGCDTSEPECQLPLTGFAVQEEEQIARSAAAVTATLQNLHTAASTRKLTSKLTAPWRLMNFHHRLSARAEEIVRQTQFLPPTKKQFDFLDNDALVREIKAMPDLNVDILLERVDVIEIPEGCWREVQKFADQLEGKRLTKNLVENMSMRLIRESTLVVCADRRGRQKALGRRDVPDVSAVCLFISNADCFQNLMFEAFGPPPPKSTPARQLVFRQMEGAAKFTKPLRAKNEDHEGDMYGVGIREFSPRPRRPARRATAPRRRRHDAQGLEQGRISKRLPYLLSRGRLEKRRRLRERRTQ